MKYNYMNTITKEKKVIKQQKKQQFPLKMDIKKNQIMQYFIEQIANQKLLKMDYENEG